MNKSKGFTIIELLMVIAIIGILAALATREYSKYVERANLSSYALPLAKDCFTELAEYCALNPNGQIPIASLRTCNSLTTNGIPTAKGTVRIEGSLPTQCNGTVPAYAADTNIVVTLDSATRYNLVCEAKQVEQQGSQIMYTPECTSKAKVS